MSELARDVEMSRLKEKRCVGCCKGSFPVDSVDLLVPELVRKLKSLLVRPKGKLGYPVVILA